MTSLAAGELTARVDDRIRLQIPFWATPDHDHDLILHDEGGIRGRPNGRFKKWRLNSFGFRSPEMTRSPAARCTRVMVLGASESFGFYESEDHEYPAQLQTILSRSGCFETVNAAVVGLTVPGITHLWNHWASGFEPEMVIIYATPAFYLSNSPPQAPQPGVMPPDVPVAWCPRLLDRAHNVFHYPAFIQRHRVERWLAVAHAGHDDAWFFKTVPEDRLEQFVDDVDALLTAVSTRGAAAVLVTHATAFHRPPLADEIDEVTAWNQFMPRAWPGIPLAFEDTAAQGLRELAVRRNVPIVDAASVMNGHREWFAEDFIHFSDDGAAAMARLIAERIRAVQ
jgi:hypothetical protein